ncbi:pro-sigmaK processing inhibitor BofA family protein [Halalkalicoccus subterraneus]|uniref:pro-sigmaK processing inhibitor BofA family protein n=1 Tax=Halalkalicoccus subterraneus TaxID=2675002 RepID=UPI000EFB9385|nr:pro-sigmaK processing inhibitor BofA family protein [Halalkalicoccus subterraneus]
MVTGLEIAVLVAVLVLLLGSYRVIHTVRPFIVNAVVGLVVLLLASTFGFGVEITPIVLVIVAIGGVPGALLVVLLAYVGLAFSPIVVSSLLLAV